MKSARLARTASTDQMPASEAVHHKSSSPPTHKYQLHSHQQFSHHLPKRESVEAACVTSVTSPDDGEVAKAATTTTATSKSHFLNGGGDGGVGDEGSDDDCVVIDDVPCPNYTNKVGECCSSLGRRFTAYYLHVRLHT